MNSVQTITLKLFRMYGTKHAVESIGIKRKMELLKEQRNSRITLDSFEENDPEIYESEFEEALQSDIMQESTAAKNKELLAGRIVKSKYFKEREPNFLTYIEKDQIKTLHRNDPIEWTPEKLSESFPALPETIKKVLRSKWIPQSVDTIIKYDSKVIENWKNFKTDKLAVSPALKKHLMKFRDRKISLLDREVLERFVLRPIEFPKPKTNYYSSILEENVDDASKTIEKVQITDGKKAVEAGVESGRSSNEIDPRTERYDGRKGEKFLFTEFMKRKLNDSDGTPREERELLLNIYRKHVESTNSEDINSNMLDNATKYVGEGNSSIVKNVSNENALVVKSEAQTKVAAETSVERKGLDTYVQERISLMDTNFDYAQRIKIPKNAFKKGMTYRIKDCYYDDDGEFLYRVPGLRF